MRIHEIMRKLAKDRPIFHSEADFQHSLAFAIRNEYSSAKVRLEYPIRLITQNPDELGALDIWIQNRKIAIELKYKVSKFEYTNRRGESFSLKQGMGHQGRYLFIKDLGRIETLTRNYDVKKAYSIIITNNDQIWSESRSQGASREFALVGILKGTRMWRGKDPRKKPISLHREYSMDWEDYSKPNNNRFRYLAIEVQ